MLVLNAPKYALVKYDKETKTPIMKETNHANVKHEGTKYATQICDIQIIEKTLHLLKLNTRKV